MATTLSSPYGTAAFLIAAFVLAGLAQARWLGASAARHFDWPLDLGLSWRGRRVFGANKTARGFVVMVPAAAASFAGLAAVASGLGMAPPWALTDGEYLLLGAAAGLGFMAGELPNSFVKRQLDVPPGQPPRSGPGRFVSTLVDRVDSIAGMMIVLACLVPVPYGTWLIVVAIGPSLHLLFSLLAFRWGGKGRPA